MPRPWISWLKNPPLPLGMALAALLSSAALWVQVLLEPKLGLVMFLTLYPVMFLMAWWCGTIPALVALMCCVLGVDYLFIGPRYALGFYDSISLVRMGFFVANNLLVIWLVQRGRRAEAQAVRYLQEAQESGLRLLFASRATQDAIWDWNLETDEVLWNDSIKTNFGYTEQAKRGTSAWWVEHIHPDDRAEVKLGIMKVIEGGGEHWAAEYKFRRGSGGYAEVFDRGFLVRGLGGRPLRMVGAMQDITERKRAERELQRFKELVDSSSDFISVADPERGLLYINRGGREMIGLGDEAPSLTEPTAIVAPEFRDRIAREVIPQTLERGRWMGEIALLDQRTKESIPALLNSFSLEDSERPGRKIVAGVSRDIRELKRGDARYRALAESLAREQDRFDRVAQAADLGVWFCDLPFDKLIWNEKVKQHFWLPASAEVTIQEFYDHLHPEDRESTRVAIERSISENTLFDKIYRTVPAPGSSQYKSIRAIGWADYDGTGRPVRFDGITLDVTDLHRQQSDLLNAVTARDNFLSMASHELKTPLTSLKLHAQMFRRYLGQAGAIDPARAQHIAHQMDRQVSRITRLVDDMLDISRIQAGKLWLQTESVDLVPLVAETMSRMEPQFLEVGVAAPALRGVASLVIEVDPLKIEQVVVNLLTNAHRYGQGKPVEVFVGSGPSAGARISVRDKGAGIRPENHEKIFERFERAAAGTDISGLGLGLYISREIVRAHGGEISVESEPGRGSVFHVDLPHTR